MKKEIFNIMVNYIICVSKWKGGGGGGSKEEIVTHYVSPRRRSRRSRYHSARLPCLLGYRSVRVDQGSLR